MFGLLLLLQNNLILEEVVVGVNQVDLPGMMMMNEGENAKKKADGEV